MNAYNQYNAMATELYVLRQEVEQIQAQKHELQQQVKESLRKLARLQMQYNKAQIELGNAREEREASDRKIEELTRRLSVQTAVAETLRSRNGCGIKK